MSSRDPLAIIFLVPSVTFRPSCNYVQALQGAVQTPPTGARRTSTDTLRY